VPRQRRNLPAFSDLNKPQHGKLERLGIDAQLPGKRVLHLEDAPQQQHRHDGQSNGEDHPGDQAGDVEDDGGSWYLLDGDRVYTVALSSLAVTSVTTLSRQVRLGDWAYWNGALIALSTLDSPNALVQIDPLTGAVTELARPAGLSRGSTYGAIWVLGDRLYALHNGEGRLYGIDLSHPSSAELVASGLRTTRADGAACPPGMAPPAQGLPPIGEPPVAPAATSRPRHAPPAIAPPGMAAPINPAPARPPAVNAPRGPKPVRARAAQPATSVNPADPTPLRRWIAAGVVVLAIGGRIATRAAK
jgi:hypothetical protein